MAARGVHFALQDAEVRELESRDDDEARLEYVQEEIEEQFFENRQDDLAETDKAWDAPRTFISLARADGDPRDLLEAVTHGPRGDIVDVYTTFPWAALCDEVKKLKIGLREGPVLDGDFQRLASRFAATQKNARNRWGKSAALGSQNTYH
jgi:hypothetical protein